MRSRGDGIRQTGSGGKRRRMWWAVVVVGTVTVLTLAEKKARGIEVTLVLNTPEKHRVTGTLKEVKEDGTITLIGTYGEETYKKDQYLTATCPEPAEQALANQSYLKGEYAKALEMYQRVYGTYRNVGWGAASLEGMGKCHRQMGNLEGAIASYSKLLEQYPSYTGGRRVRFSLAQVCEAKGDLGLAVELYEQVAAESDDELSAVSLRNMGNIHYARKKYNEALLNYLRVAILYQNLPRAPVAEATFRAADCFERLAQGEKSAEVAARLRERAKKYYLEVTDRFPQSEYAKESRLRYQRLSGGAATGESAAGKTSSAKAGGGG